MNTHRFICTVLYKRPHTPRLRIPPFEYRGLQRQIIVLRLQNKKA
jgi:hypothetical protein